MEGEDEKSRREIEINNITEVINNIQANRF